MAAPEHASRFSLKRIAYTLKTKIHPFTSASGERGYSVRTENQGNLSPTSSLGWTDTTIGGRFTIPGNAKMTTQEGAIVFTAENGASVTRYADGSMIYAASASSPVSHREQLRREQVSRPWWEKDREAIENEYIYEAGTVAAEPVHGETKQKGTPYKHFKLAVPVSETETRDFDVYAYGQAISLINRRGLHQGDTVRVRASVQFHEQRQQHGRSMLVPWLNLFDVQKLK